MSTSVFELFSIGIGPSSSHTIGPMRAILLFLKSIALQEKLPFAYQLKIELYGSLAFTGVGHGTDKALLLGAMGYDPETVAVDAIDGIIEKIKTTKQLHLLQSVMIDFDPKSIYFHTKDTLPKHSNGMRFSLLDKNAKLIKQDIYYSVGGGFVVTEATFDNPICSQEKDIPYPFKTAKSLTEYCSKAHKTIAQVMMANEEVLRSEQEIKQRLHKIWEVMRASIENGCKREGILPGGLKVKRRAKDLAAKLKNLETKGIRDDTNWVHLYAIAVNEENAAGARIVTAPTNGAAGIIPAVLEYYVQSQASDVQEAIEIFLLTAGAICILFKEGASLSAAEMGCQGEVGVACAMAAAGLCAVLGGEVSQIQNAAEIAMEHNLGLTCDPVGGLVQVPCIERNAIGASQAIAAAKLALCGDGEHFISLDKVIATMKETGENMSHHYKETSIGGLARVKISHPDC